MAKCDGIMWCGKKVVLEEGKKVSREGVISKNRKNTGVKERKR